ncbi:hypothetical protein [Defluviimonas sp. SAOS-178_SWC]|uniref:hypothetical protein n=1 Tax=Defluviimonas sp. SAOS-178_SWC TaxID=3121287 RepID=UPI00322167B2
MKHKLFALSLGFGGVIFATHHAFAETQARCATGETVVDQFADQRPAGGNGA